METPTPPVTQPLANRIIASIDELPTFVQPTAAALLPVVQRMTEDQLWAFDAALNNPHPFEAAKQIYDAMTMPELAESKMKLNASFKRMASDRATTRNLQRDLMRAALRAAVTAAVASV